VSSVTDSRIASPPLAGWRILVTRASEQAGGLSRRLADLGAVPIEFPLIEITPAPPEPLDAAIGRLATYDWVVFTSVNGVSAFLARLAALGLDPLELRCVQVAAIGRATANALERAGAHVAFVPEHYVAESMVTGLTALGVAGNRILLPRADIARDTLPTGLRAAGAVVDVVIAYHTAPVTHVDGNLLDDLRAERIDAITLGSPSAVRSLVRVLGDWRPQRAVVACIGPITARATRDAGFTTVLEAAEYSFSGLIELLVTHASQCDDARE
jgi:uroporphyrinogen-III synthase